MYLHHKILLGLIGFVAFLLSYSFDFVYSTDLSGQIITAFSIFFGFYVTSASLILAGDAIEVLHDTVDERGDRRLTHTLRDYYSFGLIMALLGIAVFLCVIAFCSSENTSISNFDLAYSWSKFAAAIASGFLAVNLVFAFLQTRLFLVLFINEPYVKIRRKN